MTRYIVIASVLCLTAAPLHAATIIVDAAGGGDYTLIQDGINMASDGDTVLVWPGTYKASGNRDLDFQTKNIVLKSTGGPAVTIIDGESHTGYRAFNFYNGGQDSTCVVRGFTIKRFRMTLQNGPGAGIRCEMNASPKFADLIVTLCTASGTFGGGMYCNNGASPLLENVRFDGNTAYAGGGLYCNNGSSPTLYNVEFVDNQVTGLTGKGGGLYCGLGSAPQVLGATFERNATTQYGGGVYCWQSSPGLSGVTFIRNEAGDQGGALFCDDDSSPMIQGATFFANSAGENGGTYAALDHSHPTILTAILSFTGAAKGFTPDPNTVGEPFYCDGTSAPTIQWACVFGNAGGDTLCGSVADTIVRDPLFCNITADDLTLASNSLCIDTNNPWGRQLGALGQGCVNSPVVPTSWGRIKALYR